MRTSSSSLPLCTSSVPVTRTAQVPVVELLAPFLSSVIKGVFLILTDMDPGKKEVFYKRAVLIDRSLLSIPRSKEKLGKQTPVAQKYIIVGSKKFL